MASSKGVWTRDKPHQLSMETENEQNVRSATFDRTNAVAANKWTISEE
jgi:hypothetical protein